MKAQANKQAEQVEQPHRLVVSLDVETLTPEFARADARLYLEMPAGQRRFSWHLCLVTLRKSDDGWAASIDKYYEAGDLAARQAVNDMIERAVLDFLKAPARRGGVKAWLAGLKQAVQAVDAARLWPISEVD
jgi:hypothetical protein